MSDEEYERRLEVREQIPEILRPPLLAWAARQVTDYNGSVTEMRGHELQSALRVPLELDRYSDPQSVVGQFESHGDRELLFLVDYLLSEIDEDPFVEPAAIEDLRWHMDQTRSALTIAGRNRVYRLAHRLPDGVEDLLVASATEANATAGAHLRNAIREATTLDGRPSTVMSEDIRAVEAAAGPVVTPKDQRFQLSRIVSHLKAISGWSIILQRRDDNVPDHQAILIGMLETLAFAQRDRHSGTPPTSEEALAHMMLTSTVVGWFSTGAVRME